MGLAVRDDRLTLRVGTVTLLVLVLCGGLRVALDGFRLQSGFSVTVYFERLGGIQEGADVQVAGRVVGEVIGISLVPAHRARAGHLLHPNGGAAVLVRIEDRYAHMAPINGEVFISNRGIFGEKYLEVGAPIGGAHERPMRAGDEIRGIDLPDMDKAVVRGYRNMQIAREFMDAIRPSWIEFAAAMSALGDTLSGFEVSPAAVAISGSVGDLVREARLLRGHLDSAGLDRARLSRLTSDAQAVGVRLDRSMDDIRRRLHILGGELVRMRSRIPADTFDRLQGIRERVNASLVKAQLIVDQTRELLDIVRRGEGTIGALWNDPEFPEHAKGLGRVIKRNPWRLIGRPVNAR